MRSQLLGLVGIQVFPMCKRSITEIYICVYFCMQVLWGVCVIPCISCEREEAYQSSEKSQKMQHLFLQGQAELPHPPWVTLGVSSGSCCSPSKADLVVGNRDGNWFKIAGISFKSKKMQLFSRLGTLLQDFQEGSKHFCRWRAVDSLAVAVAHFFHDHSILGTWFLALDWV